MLKGKAFQKKKTNLSAQRHVLEDGWGWGEDVCRYRKVKIKKKIRGKLFNDPPNDLLALLSCQQEGWRIMAEVLNRDAWQC